MSEPVRPYNTLGRVRPDSKGRITLGKLAEGVSSYTVSADPQGRLILEAFAEVPAREQWLFKNKVARESVKRGIADAAAGRTRSLGAFRRFVGGKAED